MATGTQSGRRGFLWTFLLAIHAMFLTNRVSAFPLTKRPSVVINKRLRELRSSYNHDYDQDDDETSPEAFEDALKELESEKLYGLASKQVEIDQIASWVKKEKLNLFPEYQRDYVWKPEKASRLIVTVLCNRHVPPVVLHEKKRGVFTMLSMVSNGS
jgi:hypothetical protein